MHVRSQGGSACVEERPYDARNQRKDPANVRESALSFGPFRLEAAKQLWRGNQLIHLRRQSLALLRYLAERPGQLITKEELLSQLWPRIYVSPTVVRVCVREIRSALGDDAKQPQFIETLGVLGYRFIGQVVSRQFEEVSVAKFTEDGGPAISLR